MVMIRLWTEDPPYEIKGKYWQAVVKENVLPDLGAGKMTVMAMLTFVSVRGLAVELSDQFTN
jgi:hypothetical protein